MRTALLFLSCLTLAPATASAATSPLELVVSDGQRLRQHWTDGIYGRLWNDDLLAGWRERVATSLSEQATRDGVAALDVLGSVRSLALALHGFAPDADRAPEARTAFQVDLGAQAEPVFAVWRRAGALAELAGSDGAFRLTDPTADLVARFGTTIVRASEDTLASPWPARVDPADLALTFDGAALLAAVNAGLAPADRQAFATLTATIEPWLASGSYEATLVAEGLQERLIIERPLPWLIPVDRAQLARLPATTLATLALGVDGKALWTMGHAPVLAALGRDSGASAEEVEAFIDANLEGMGVIGGLAGLVADLRGTVQVAVTAGAPLPGVSVVCPRAGGFDLVIKTLIAQAGGVVPAEGGSSLLAYPGLPVQLLVARDQEHWLLTSDHVLGASWVQGGAGGWSESAAGRLALEQAPEGAALIGASDTPAVLRFLVPLLTMGLAANRDMAPADRQTVLQVVQRLSELASTGYLVGRTHTRGFQFEARGIAGPLLATPALSSLAIPTLLRNLPVRPAPVDF